VIIANPGDKPQRQTGSDLAPTALSPEQRAFHVKEYEKLTAEVTDALKNINDLFKGAIVLSGAVFTWCLAQSSGKTGFTLPEGPLRLAMWIPSALSAAMGLLSLAQLWRIYRIGEYLRDLEQALGSPSLGWERHWTGEDRETERARSRRPMLSAAGLLAWATLLAGQIIIALIATKH